MASTPAFNSCINFTDHGAPVTTPKGNLTLMGILVYALPILIGLGVCGNIISFIILKASAKRLPSHFYLCCLTFSDIMALLCLIPSYWAAMIVHPYYHDIGGEHITWVERYLMIYGLCQARLYFSFLFRCTSIWIIVIFTFERFFSVFWPLHANRLCTLRNSIIVMVILFVVSACLHLPWWFSFDPLKRPCSLRVVCKANKVLIINRLIESIVLSILPAIIICSLNVAIVINLRQQLHAMKHLHDKRSISKQQTIITRRLLVVSSVFVVLTFPQVIVVSIMTYQEFRGNTSYRSGALANLYHIAMYLFMVNLAINFILYLLTGENFRKSAYALLCCQLPRMRYYRNLIVRGSSAVDGDGKQRRNTGTQLTDLNSNTGQGSLKRYGSRGSRLNLDKDPTKHPLLESPQLSLRNGDPQLAKRLSIEIKRSKFPDTSDSLTKQNDSSLTSPLSSPSIGLLKVPTPVPTPRARTSSKASPDLRSLSRERETDI